MRHPIELAAYFFRRGEFVLGNDVLKDEYGVEYNRPGQVEYLAIYRDNPDARAINESLIVYCGDVRLPDVPSI